MTRERLNGPHTNVFCETCKEEKEMYYVPWCPVCEKPQREKKEVLNLIKATRHIEVLTNDFGTKEKYHLDCYSRRVWMWLIDNDKIPGNDSFVNFWRPEGLDEEDPQGFTKQEQKDIKLFCDTFDITEYGVLLDISW